MNREQHSLAGLSARYQIISIILLALVLLLVIIFSLSIYRMETGSESYRSTISLVNSVISELNRINADPPEMRNYKVLEERINRLLDAITLHRYPESFSGNLSTLHLRLAEPGRNDSISHTLAVQEVGSVARALSERFYSNRDSLAFFSVLSISLSLVSIVVLFILTILMRSANLRFHRQIAAGFQLMQQTIDHDADALPPFEAPRWKEEEVLKQTVENLAMQIRQDRELREMEPQHNLETLIPEIKPLLDTKVPCDRLSIAFLDTHGILLAEAVASDLPQVCLEPGFTEHISQTSLGRLVQQKHPRIINDLEEHQKERGKSRANDLLLKEGIRSSITVPLFFEQRCVGFLFASSTRKGVYQEHHAHHVRKVAYTVKQQLYYSFVLQQVIAEASRAFVKLTEKKDNETSLHILRMAQYSYLIAKQLKIMGSYQVSPRFMRELLWFAPLHDIGKIGVPDAVLLKPGRLDPSEWGVMETHVSIGEDVLLSMQRGIGKALDEVILDTAIDIIGSHHEKWDGSGYPRGLQGESIPLAGRIVAVADVFDALTSKRPYKDAYGVEEALEIIHQGRGSHFDPVILDAFDSALPEILEIYEHHKEI